MAQEKLKPCPWPDCESDQVGYVFGRAISTDTAPVQSWVTCFDCGAAGPKTAFIVSESEERAEQKAQSIARELWNRRATHDG